MDGSASGRSYRQFPARVAAALSVFLGAGLMLAPPVAAAAAPGAPGGGSSWTSGLKQGLGTSTTTTSKLWYTIGQGITDEVFYPQADTPNVQDLQYLVTDGSTFTDNERDDAAQTVTMPDPRSLTYQQVNTATSGRWRITKTYVTDPARATLLVQTRFQVLTGGPLQLFVLFNPSLNGSGMNDTGATSGGQLVGSDGPVASALATSSGFTATTNGYSGTASDPWTDLTTHHALTTTYDSVGTAGNLVQAGQVGVGTDTTFTLALAFGATRTEASSNASASLASGWAGVSTAYQSGWHTYLAGLKPVPPDVAAAGQAQLYATAVMAIAAHEDKTYRGAFVASLSTPWGQATNADNGGVAGYHAVWARDLYEMATALIADGDTAAAGRALDYLFDVQQKDDGSFPQNTWLNGTPYWPSLQLDEVSFPLVLADTLGRTDAATWAKVKKSADYVVAHGPYTPQERWEESGGWSPATIAAQIAGLVSAADIAGKNGDTASADSYLSTADSWRNSVDAWTYTTSGHLPGGRYYERIDNNGNPNDGSTLSISNGGGNWDERDVVDGGFLELVRLGITPPTDTHVTNSLTTLDATIKRTINGSDYWYRYNHDGYGETSTGGPYTGAGVGRLWPVLSGERGEYALARGQSAAPYLAAMAKAATEGHLIPEQIWDVASGYGFTQGSATGSANPLAWALGQYVRLAQSTVGGKNLDTPQVVCRRYGTCPGSASTQTFTVTVPPDTDATGRSVYLAGNLSVLGGGQPDWGADGVLAARVDATHWNVSVTGAPGATLQYKLTLGDWNHVERNGSCVDITNRTLTLPAAGNVSTVPISVASWRNVSPCGP
jgi:glucoamylase